MPKTLLKKWTSPFKKQKAMLPLSLGGGLGIALLAAAVFWTLGNAKDPSPFLPSRQTLAYVQLGSSHPDLASAQLDGELSLSAVSALSKLPLEDFPQRWWSRPFGLALIQSSPSANEWVLFAKAGSKRSILKALRSLAAPGGTLTESYGIYSYSQGPSFHSMLAGPFVFISQSRDAIQSISQMQAKQAPPLAEKAGFLTNLSHLPRQAWASGYLKLDGLSFPQAPALNYALQALKPSVSQLSWTVRDQSDGLKLNALLTLDPKKDSPALAIAQKELFSHRLAQHLPAQETAFYVGGENLTAEWQATLTDLSALNPSYGIILEGVVRAQVEEIFGQGVNLRNDFYPLFEGEYAAMLAQGEKGFSLGLVMSHRDRAFATAKLEKLLDGFYYLSSRFAPQLESILLPDGTQSRELVPNPAAGEKKVQQHGGAEFVCMEGGSEDAAELKERLFHSFCYAVTDSLIFLTTDAGLMHSALETMEAPDSGLSQSPVFAKSVNGLSKVSNEMGYFETEKLLPIFGQSPTAALLQKALAPFASAAWTKRSFPGSVSVEGYLLEK